MRVMTHVVTSACIDHKYQDCVAVCPVEAFREADSYLVIDPDECIDCAACVTECPVEAIKPENEDLLEWVEMNRKYSELWENITVKKDAPADADEFAKETNKYPRLFSEKSGTGDA